MIHVQNDNRNLCNPSAACSWPGFSRGSLIGFGLMAVAYVISRRRGYQVRTEPIGCQELFSRFKDALLALLTPTESASVAVFYALIVGMFVFRELKLKDLGPIFLRSGLVTAFIMLIAGVARIFSELLASEQIPQQISQTILSVTRNPLLILILRSGSPAGRQEHWRRPAAFRYDHGH